MLYFQLSSARPFRQPSSLSRIDIEGVDFDFESAFSAAICTLKLIAFQTKAPCKYCKWAHFILGPT